jgi:hypothetical protein
MEHFVQKVIQKVFLLTLTEPFYLVSLRYTATWQPFIPSLQKQLNFVVFPKENYLLRIIPEKKSMLTPAHFSII